MERYVQERDDIKLERKPLVFCTFLVAIAVVNFAAFLLLATLQPTVPDVVQKLTHTAWISSGVLFVSIIGFSYFIFFSFFRTSKKFNEFFKNNDIVVSLANALPVGVVFCDRNFHIKYANNTYRNWRNMSEEELIGMHAIEIIGNEAFEKAEPVMKRVLHGETITRDIEGIFQDGNQRMVQITHIPFYSHSHKIIGLVSVMVDMTDVKIMQMKLDEEKCRAERANLAKSMFLANMSHEIRTPLSAILGFCKILAEQDLAKEDKRRYYEIIERNGNQLSEVIGDILDISKVEAGKIEIKKSKFALFPFIKDIEDFMTLKAAAKHLLMSFHFDMDHSLTIVSDPQRLRQIILNIIGNAIKFTSYGQITVNLFLKKIDNSLRLCVDVIDTGMGIPNGKTTDLFRPFSRLENAGTATSGTGLGLKLSRDLARLLGGDVKILSSEPGVGSTFRITIDPSPIEYDNQLQGNTCRIPVPIVGSKLNGVKILLAEDSPDLQELERHILESSGATVEIVENGLEALEKASEELFDIAILDIHMPVMDGFEAVSKLKDQGFGKPILALTAFALKEDREHILRSGFDYCISKPIDAGDMVACVHECVQKSKSLNHARTQEDSFYIPDSYHH